MITTTRDSTPDPSVAALREALEQYGTEHPGARIEVTRRNPVSIWIRVIDPDFRGIDRVAREEHVWPILEALPEEIQADISLLLLLTPEEAARTFANHGGGASANPLLEAILDYLREGKQFVEISPERYAEGERMVLFRFADGIEEARIFRCDHGTFMTWWKEMANYLRRAATAIRDPDGDRPGHEVHPNGPGGGG
jgi:hypothetical protein